MTSKMPAREAPATTTCAGTDEPRMTSVAFYPPTNAISRSIFFMQRHAWIVLCALLVALALSVQLWLTSLFSFSESVVHAAIDILPWLFALPAVVWLANRLPIAGPHRIRHFFVHVGACVACSLALPLMTFGVLHWSGVDIRPRRSPLPPPPPPSPESIQSLPPLGAPDRPRLWWPAMSRAPMHWAIYALVVALAHGWRLARSAQAREREAAELERSLTDARMTALTQQLQPHFLFNTLNTIAWLIRQDGRKAEDLLLDLSELLRQTLQASRHHTVPVHEELRLLDLYLDIQRVRFGSRLEILRMVPDDSLDASMPVLLFQPLVENALRHGLDRTFDVVSITIEVMRVAEKLHLSVRDDARTSSSGRGRPGPGIGLNNIQARLTTLYGSAATFTARPLPQCGFLAECVIPFRLHGEITSIHN